MHRLIILTAAFLLLLASPAMSAEFKFGLIDMQEVLQKSDPGAAAFKELQGKFNDMKTDMDKRKAEIEKLREDMEKQSMALSQDARQEKQMDLQRKMRDFQDLAQNYQRKMATEQDKASKPIIEVLVKVIEEYGKKNGFSALMDKKGSGLLYANADQDVTKQIILELNQAWKSKGK